MTDNITLQQAAEQALEALEYTIKPLCMCFSGCDECDPNNAPDIEKAITNLRAALAKPLAKREWVGLTWDEVFGLNCVSLDYGLDFSDCSIDNASVHEFARVIEAKLKEKNT